MADNAPGGIQRSLEGGGNLFLNKWWTGLYKNRSPLFTPISVLGIQLVARQDALWDGANLMVTPQFTLRRRYGFLKSSTTALGSNEWPLTGFSLENLSGEIWNFVDTQSRVANFTSGSIATLFTKAAGAGQSSFQSVENIMYWCDGVDAMKYIGPNLLTQSNSFGTSPWTKADATLTTGQTDPLGGTTATYAVFSSASTSAYIEQTVTPNYTPVAGNPFTLSIWMKANTGTPTVYLEMIDSGSNVMVNTQQTLSTTWTLYTITGTAAASTTTVTVKIIDPSSTSAHYFLYGAQLEIGGVATPTQITNTLPQGVYLWGIVAPSESPTLQFANNGSLVPLIGYQYGYCFENPVTGQLSTMSPASANTGPLDNQTIVEAHTIPAPSGPYTVTVTNSADFIADGGVVIASTGVPLTLVSGTPSSGQYKVAAGVYTFNSAQASTAILITYTFSFSGSTGVTITVGGQGSADPQVGNVWIFRTKDGGSEYYFLASITNPGNTTWTYTDNTLDSQLNNDIIAPVADFNNPPPTGASLVTWYGGRLWAVVGNTIYFSAGPDSTIGVGEENWPPGNNYTVPGNANAWCSTSSGLIIFTKDTAFVITGQDSSSYTTPAVWQNNFGVPSQNCVTQDGDNIFVFTVRGQVWNFGASGISEIGYTQENVFGAMTPANVYITIHRSGADEGLFVSDGSANIYRYSQLTTSWDTAIQPVGGCKAIFSMEGPNASWSLFMGRAAGSGYLLQRDLNTWTDDGTAYTAWATVGSITIAPPRQVANLASILLQVTGVGTYPTVAVMLNEITDTGTYPTTFTVLPKPVADPPQLALTQSVWTRRHDLKAAQRPLPAHVQHLQTKITFATEAQPNELLGLGFAHKAI
ncbi:MAG: hypothetical protein WAU89_13395 [Candidatus Acidiferrales bacterium]